LVAIASIAVGLASPAAASTITFEDKVGPAHFDDPMAFGPLHYVVGSISVDFSGGTLLTNESNETADNSSVYATAISVPGEILVTQPGLTNPLVVTFSQNIQNFSMDILNAYSGNYRMSDNQGHSTLFNLATTGDMLVTEGFAAAGNQVTIEYLGPLPGFIPANLDYFAWDFAVDNITFNEPLNNITVAAPVPEPGTIALFGTGIVALVARLRRKARTV